MKIHHQLKTCQHMTDGFFKAHLGLKEFHKKISSIIRIRGNKEACSWLGCEPILSQLQK